MIRCRCEFRLGWSIIQPLLPNKPRGVPRADHRKILDSIFWRLCIDSPWADIFERYGPAPTYSGAGRPKTSSQCDVRDAMFSLFFDKIVRDISSRAPPALGSKQDG